jgi:hypothetical protein
MTFDLSRIPGCGVLSFDMHRLPKGKQKMSNTTLATLPISIMENGEREHYTVKDGVIEFNPSTPKESWLTAVAELTGMYESSYKVHCRAMFMLGDALNFGEGVYGEEFSQAIEDTRVHMGVSAKTIMNVAAICKKIPASIRRVDTVPLAIHDAVARLEPKEQSELLATAEEKKWTLKDAKEEIKKRHPKAKGGKDRQARKKAVIDTESEEGLQHAAQVILDWFEREHPAAAPKEAAKKTGGMKALSLNDWPQGRKRSWSALTGLAKIARRMGIAR